MKSLTFIALAIVLSACDRGSDIDIDTDDIAGVVTSSTGVEAGVWVIAETHDLGTRFIRSVVTDEEGRYLVPDLPDANYELWVRGYGLQDSERMAATPGSIIDIEATVAPDAATAAQVYPAAYWYSMVEVPDKRTSDGLPGGDGLVSVDMGRCVPLVPGQRIATNEIRVAAPRPIVWRKGLVPKLPPLFTSR